MAAEIWHTESCRKVMLVGSSSIRIDISVALYAPGNDYMAIPASTSQLISYKDLARPIGFGCTFCFRRWHSVQEVVKVFSFETCMMFVTFAC